MGKAGLEAYPTIHNPQWWVLEIENICYNDGHLVHQNKGNNKEKSLEHISVNLSKYIWVRSQIKMVAM